MTDRQARTMKGIRLQIAFSCLALASCGVAHGQPTNQEVYQNLALRCLAEVPDTAQAFRLDAPTQMPYVRSALTEAWGQDGRVLFLDAAASSPTASASPHLQYKIEEARVTYARSGRKHLARSVVLALRYTFTTAEGRLLREAGCRETYTDTIRRTERSAFETPTFPETQGELPRGSWRRRYLEPAVLAMATAVTIYLFFNLRSDRSRDGV